MVQRLLYSAAMSDQSNVNERFQIRDLPTPDGKIVGTYATREEADEALRDMRQDKPGVNFTLMDAGVQTEKTEEEIRREQAIEAKKTAEEKAIDAKLEDEKGTQAAGVPQGGLPTNQDTATNGDGVGMSGADRTTAQTGNALGVTEVTNNTGK